MTVSLDLTFRRADDGAGLGLRLGGGQSAIEDALLAVRAILVDHSALGRLVEGRRDFHVLDLRFVQLAGCERGLELLLPRFQAADHARITGVALVALASAFCY